MEDVKSDIKEGIENTKEDAENTVSDIKSVEIIKEEARDIKKDIQENVKKGVEEVMEEMIKNIEKPEIKEGNTRKRIRNIERSNVSYSRVQARGQLYLGYIQKVGPETQDFWWNPRPETWDPSCGWDPGPETQDF